MMAQADEGRRRGYTVVIVPSPGMGHLIPLVELAKRLVLHHGLIKVSFIIPNDGSPSKAQESLLLSLPTSTFSYSFLPPVSFHDLPPHTRIETIISLTVSRSLPSLRDSFSSLSASTTLLALFVDLFGTDAFDVARDFNVPPYIFFPSTTTALSLFFYLPTLDQSVDCEYRELTQPVTIPGCIPLHGSELLDPVQDRKDDAYRWVLHHTKRYRLAQGILENSFEELEPGPVRYLLGEEPGRPPVYPVGPLVNMDPPSSSSSGGECLRWLDKQPPGSVLYVSFGSGGTLSREQMDELAHGLEMSGQRFLWVVRSPNDTAANATYFSVNNGQREPCEFLPGGFLERTKKRGMVVASWAPQAQVLGHGATGGFLTHCGWNSTLESVVNGVPMIAWPLYAEQKMNAAMLTRDVKVALRPAGVGGGEGGVVRRGEIARVVRGLIEGEEGKDVRYRMRDLKLAASKALSEHGSSTKALAEVVRRLLSTATTTTGNVL